VASPLRAQVDVLSLALIGNASADESWLEPRSSCRGVFDKETRRKPLAFAADAGYGDWMALWYPGTCIGVAEFQEAGSRNRIAAGGDMAVGVSAMRWGNPRSGIGHTSARSCIAHGSGSRIAAGLGRIEVTAPR